MGVPSLVALAVGPGLCLTHVLWTRDRAREPLGNVFVYLLLGAAAVIPAVLLGGVLQALLRPEGSHANLLLLAVWVFFGVALIEEGSKRMLLFARARSDRHLDEPFDWVVYAVAVALGFATIENILYVLQGGAGVGVVRAFTAVPAHALDGTMMGWRLARAARLDGAAARRERRLALWEPAAWHAAYDLPLFAMESAGAGATAPLLLAWGIVLLCQWRICVRRIGALAREQHRRAPPVMALDEIARRLRERERT